ncbi:MAG: PT domain-containing protein [Clostridia bacterium]|nr:PT domain-containing protein [Clostridia bacterium]
MKKRFLNFAIILILVITMILSENHQYTNKMVVETFNKESYANQNINNDILIGFVIGNKASFGESIYSRYFHLEIGDDFPEVPTVYVAKNYIHDGWIDEKGNVVTEFPEKVTETKTYTPVSKLGNYGKPIDIVFDSGKYGYFTDIEEGGYTTSELLTITSAVGEEYPNAPELKSVDKGYEFDYWRDPLGNKIKDFPNMVTEEGRYTAIWKMKNSSTTEPSEEPTDVPTESVEPTQTPEPTDIPTEPEESKPSELYTYTFKAGSNGKINGQTGDVKYIVKEGDSFPTVPTVTANKGYIFAGWINENKMEVESFPSIAEYSQIYVATWVKGFTVSFKLNEGIQNVTMNGEFSERILEYVKDNRGNIIEVYDNGTLLVPTNSNFSQYSLSTFAVPTINLASNKYAWYENGRKISRFPRTFTSSKEYILKLNSQR